ncbi:MAG: signal peptidase I [Oscillospiraceae bacterium]|jgi:signal peptidase I|nr:signal peptidase I [Oscillospiraceae bacterium]
MSNVNEGVLGEAVVPSIKPIKDAANAAKAAKEGSEGKKSVGREIFEWVVTVLVVVAITLTVRTFVFEPIRVDGESMIHTLENNEYTFTTKIDYVVGEPERFDVIICQFPGRTERFVKRLVGLPGDRIEVNGGFLTVNGERYEEEYLTNRPGYTGAWELGENEYFVLGDNRPYSNDSHLIGPLTRSQIIGHVRCVIWPLNKIRLVK